MYRSREMPIKIPVKTPQNFPTLPPVPKLHSAYPTDSAVPFSTGVRIVQYCQTLRYKAPTMASHLMNSVAVRMAMVAGLRGPGYPFLDGGDRSMSSPCEEGEDMAVTHVHNNGLTMTNT